MDYTNRNGANRWLRTIRVPPKKIKKLKVCFSGNKSNRQLASRVVYVIGRVIFLTCTNGDIRVAPLILCVYAQFVYWRSKTSSKPKLYDSTAAVPTYITDCGYLLSDVVANF